MTDFRARRDFVIVSGVKLRFRFGGEAHMSQIRDILRRHSIGRMAT